MFIGSYISCFLYKILLNEFLKLYFNNELNKRLYQITTSVRFFLSHCTTPENDHLPQKNGGKRRRDYLATFVITKPRYVILRVFVCTIKNVYDILN